MHSYPPVERSSRRTRSLLALSLIVPISSIAALASTIVAPGAIGQTIAILCGLWLVIFPITWHVGIDSRSETLRVGVASPLAIRQRLRWRVAVRKDGLLVGSIIGLLMLAIILASYWFVGRHWLDPIEMRARLDRLGMNAPLMVYGFGTFQTLVNSFIEEYVWRWFVLRHCAIVWPKSVAIWLGAGFFTLHHIILMAAYCPNLWLVAIGSIAVFAAGFIWARCAQVFNSLLPGYIAHMAADLALAIVSWHVLLS